MILVKYEDIRPRTIDHSYIVVSIHRKDGIKIIDAWTSLVDLVVTYRRNNILWDIYWSI